MQHPPIVKLVRCTRGIELRGSDEAELIAQVQRHAAEAHALALNPEQVRAMMEIVQQVSGDRAEA